MLLIIAIVGTTVAPWQLFFQQSNIIDKRITPRWINYERADTVIGAFVVVIGAGAIISDRGVRVRGHARRPGTSATPAWWPSALRTYVGPAAGACFAIVLLNASLIGAARGDARYLLRLRGRVRRLPLAAPRHQATRRCSTPRSR